MVARVRLSESAPKIERKRLSVTDMMLLKARVQAPRHSPFALPAFPPMATPHGKGRLALDDDISGCFNWASNMWQGAMSSMYAEGLVFPGYTFLAELAQRPEYRTISETIATEATRKWIKLTSTGDDDKTDQIKVIEDELDRMKVRDAFCKTSEVDNYFGRSHLYLDVGQPDHDTSEDNDELVTDIGNGRNEMSRAKVGKDFFKRVKVVEPLWVYPLSYNSNNPLSTDWYEPNVWYAMDRRIHKSRLLKFVAREVPDILKPAYAFGGLSMSQMLIPYVNNWLNTRQSVADIIKAFSTWVLSTDLSESLVDGGEQLFKRLELFNLLRNNKGVMAINKDTEEFNNVSAPLGTLDSLQAQTQEHMASVARIPLVKLLGIQPAGLNASSEGEIRTFYDAILAYQEKFYRAPLTKVIDLIQLSKFGEIDQSITFKFVPLWELDEAAAAGKRKTEADTDAVNIQSGVISPLEARRRIAADPDTPYQSLDVENVPQPPQAPGEEGDPGHEGGGPDMSGGPPMGGGENEEDEEQENGEADETEGREPTEGINGRGLGRTDRRGGAGGGRGRGHGAEEGRDGDDAGPGGEVPMGGGRSATVGPENEDIQEGLKKKGRDMVGYGRVKAGAGLVRHERHKAKANGSFTGDAGSFTGSVRDLTRDQRPMAHDALTDFLLALDKSVPWDENAHPRGPDGKFVSYGAAKGLAGKAAKLGFKDMAFSPSGKIKFEHASGAVLVIEPTGDKESKAYSFYQPGKKPIHAVTGQTAKSFVEKIGPLLGVAPESGKKRGKAAKAPENPLTAASTMAEPAKPAAKPAGNTTKPTAATPEAQAMIDAVWDNGFTAKTVMPYDNKYLMKSPDGDKISVWADGYFVVYDKDNNTKGTGQGAEALAKVMGKPAPVTSETYEPSTEDLIEEINQQEQDGLITEEEAKEKIAELKKGKKKRRSAAAPAPAPAAKKSFLDTVKNTLGFGSTTTPPAPTTPEPPATDPAIAAHLHNNGYKNEPDAALKTKGITKFKKGESEVKIAANGDWIAAAPGFSAKAGSGAANLEAFLNGEKAYGTKWNKGDPSSWENEHDPEYKKKKEEEDKKAAEKAAKEAEEYKKTHAKEIEEQKKQAAEKAKKQEAAQHTAKKVAAEYAANKHLKEKKLDDYKGDTPTGKQKSALSNYTGSAYSTINDSLRNGGPIGHDTSTKHIKDYLDECSFPENAVLYRGMKGTFAQLLKSSMTKGSVFKDLGFSSTTVNPEISFVSSAELRIRISVPKGAKGSSVKYLSNHKSEDEVLFTAGTHYRITKMPDIHNGDYWMEVDMLLPHEHPES